MKRIIIKNTIDEVNLREVSESTPIFAKLKGKLAGMIVKEKDRGWILKLGGEFGSNGPHASREICMTSALEYGYTYFIED